MAVHRIDRIGELDRRVGDDVVVVHRDVEHHVVTEGVTGAELELDRLAEVQILAPVGAAVAATDVDVAVGVQQFQTEIGLWAACAYDNRKLVLSVTGKATWMCGER